MAKLLVNYPSTHVRLFFRLLFVVLFIVIGFVGKRCLETRAKLKLMRKHHVPLSLMSNWLSSFDAILALNTLRALPGGWMGIVMIFAYLLSIGADFASALIQSIPFQDRCKFGTGLVISDFRLEVPPWNGAPFTVATQAQVTSLANGGKQGVYAKINREPRFSADATDILGEWVCTRNSLELDYPYSTAINDVVSSVMQHDLLYYTPVSIFAGNQDGNTSHLVILDTSAALDFEMVFDIRVSVDLSAQSNDTKRMQSYECTLNDTSGNGILEAIQKGINSISLLQDYNQVFQGSLYDGTGTPATPDPGTVLERILNSAIMVAGGNNYLLNMSMSTQTQGCVTTRTWILWELVALAGIVVLLVVLSLFYWASMAIQLKVLSKHMDSSDAKYIMQFTPGDTFDWMAQAVRERGLDFPGTVTASDVAHFYFGKSENASGYGVTGNKWPSDQGRDVEFSLLQSEENGSGRA